MLLYLTMAEGITIEGKSLEELEREITCGICKEHYTVPKILPCLHYYCKQCVLRLALRTGTGEPFSCPECRSKNTLPDGGVDELKTAFFINRLKMIVYTITQVHGKTEVKCELCTDSTNKAEAFCRHCTRFICTECIKLHNKLQIFLKHEVASLDDLKYGRAKPIPVKESPTKKCLVHKEPLIIYCYDCECLICQHCTMKDHRNHTFKFVKIGAPDEKLKLLEEIKPLKDLHLKFINSAEKIQTIKLEVEAQKDSAVHIIQTSFKELHDILDKRELELLDEAGAVVQDKVDKLSVQEKTLSLASAEIQSVVDYTEQCVKHGTDSEVMSMHTEMKKTIEQKIEEHSKSGRSLEPVEEADMAVEMRCAKALQKLCQTNAHIKLPIHPAKCTVHLEEAAEVGRASKGTLITHRSSKLAKWICTVSSQIKSLYTGVITDCNIDVDGPGRHSIQYTPTVRGRHELTVLIDGQHVAGSPFPVFVSIHPTQLGKPVKVWGDLTYPIGITANSKGEVLVIEQGGNIIKFDVNGRREKLVTQNELKALHYIAPNDEDGICCIDVDSDKMLMCDINGGNVQRHTVEQEYRPGRRALVIIKNELLISDMGNKGTILVYDRELTYVRHIQHKDMGIVMDISSDDHGNLYITDYNYSFIHIFSSNGVFLYSFGRNKYELKCPWSVRVSGQYVYVTDPGNHCVKVFTIDGSCVTSFGQRGTKDGEFKDPQYLYIDKDGFIYVCDFMNFRVQCF